MPDSVELRKAELQELKEDLSDVKDGGKRLKVQFNPESLKLSFSNQIATPAGGGGDQSAGTGGRQFVGAGTTKLSLQLWFDVSAPPSSGSQVDDVRKLTQEVVYFITPQASTADPAKVLPPGLRFLWGTFQFDGVVDSLEESIEFFSGEGKPLRASVSLSLSQQKILKVEFGKGAAPGAAPTPGTRPMAQAAAGDNVQALAATVGQADRWKDIAEANGIENPRLLPPGQLLDLNAFR